MDEDEKELREILERKFGADGVKKALEEKCKKRECQGCPYEDYCPKAAR